MKTFNPLNLHRLSLSARLLVSSQGKLIKIGLISLPIIIFISITLSLQLNGLLRVNSYHIETAYIGFQGRLSIKASPSTLSLISRDAKLAGFTNLLRRDENRLLNFKLEQRIITKFIRLQTLPDSEYLTRFSQFKGLTNKNNFVANRIFRRHFMGNMTLLVGMFSQQPNKFIQIDGLHFIDTGFLSSEAMLYIRESQYESLLHESFSEYNTLEFTNVSEHNITEIKELIAESTKQVFNDQLSIQDLLVDTRESRVFFEQLAKVQWVLICVVLIFAVLTIMTSTGIILAIKKNSFKILELLGLSKQELAIHVSVLITVVFFTSAAAAIIIYLSSFSKLLLYLDIPKVDFIPFELANFLLIFSFGFIVSIMSFSTVYKN